MKRLILASGSPRRRELLANLGYEFEVITSDVDETLNLNNPLIDEIKTLSYRKAHAVYKDHEDAVVIGSDTMVTINNHRLGKPHSEKEAFDMLKELSGQTHEVITAITIISSEGHETFANVSEVKMGNMSDEEILDYIKTKEPMDKAGSYAIQGIGSKFIEGIKGDYYSIMGLPVFDLYHKISKYLK